MKNIKNEHGFTLIELLAVIVVLAIVLLMGAMAVIPRMNDARKQTFALEANTAIQGAQQYLMANELKAKKDTNKVFPTSTTTPVCVTIKELIDGGVIEFESNYAGYILVNKQAEDKNTYLYQITMTNGTIHVYQAGVSGTAYANYVNVDVTSDSVRDGSKVDNKEIESLCPSTVEEKTISVPSTIK